MNSKTLKNVKTILALFVIAVVLTSCNRGGTGCPYEMEVATNILTNIVN
ncbi:MAG: hypothetical protein V3V14_04010 [Saprospiraceae bacterium]